MLVQEGGVAELGVGVGKLPVLDGGEERQGDNEQGAEDHATLSDEEVLGDLVGIGLGDAHRPVRDLMEVVADVEDLRSLRARGPDRIDFPLECGPIAVEEGQIVLVFHVLQGRLDAVGLSALLEILQKLGDVFPKLVVGVAQNLLLHQLLAHAPQAAGEVDDLGNVLLYRTFCLLFRKKFCIISE